MAAHTHREDGRRDRRSNGAGQGTGDVEHAEVLRSGARIRQHVNDQGQVNRHVHAEPEPADVQADEEPVKPRSTDLRSSGISKSEVSRICAGLDEVVGAFRTRRLEHTGFPYVFLDATYLHVRTEAAQVTSKAVVVATGVTADGHREILGLDVGDSEDEVFWSRTA